MRKTIDRATIHVNQQSNAQTGLNFKNRSLLISTIVITIYINKLRFKTSVLWNRDILSSSDSLRLVLFPKLRNVICQWVVWIGRGEQRLNGEQHGSNLQRGRPFVLQDVEADSTQFVDIWVENLGHKPHFRRRHRVLFRQKQFQIKFTWNEYFCWILEKNYERINLKIWIRLKPFS